MERVGCIPTFRDGGPQAESLPGMEADEVHPGACARERHFCRAAHTVAAAIRPDRVEGGICPNQSGTAKCIRL